MRYNNKLTALALGMSVATLLLASVSIADEDGGSRTRKTTIAAPAATVSAPSAVPLPAPIQVVPQGLSAGVPQPSVVYNFYFGSPAGGGATVPAGALPASAPTLAPTSAPAAVYAAAPAPAAPVRTQYDTYCSSCHGNSYKNSSVSKIQSGNSESSSMRAAVGSLSTAILSAIAAGQ